MMLEKIAHIMKTKGGVDDWNSDYQNNKRVIIFTTIIHHLIYRLIFSTFHQIYRQQQLDRINKDNKILMERLQTVKPYYDRMEWVSES